MIEVGTQSIRIFPEGYCSQPRMSRTPPPNLEEGLEKIDQLLKKSILCRHDVDDLNSNYQSIQLLEQSAVEIPLKPSQKVLHKVRTKAKDISEGENVQVENLISLYHLQKFVDKELPLSECLKQAQSKCAKTTENVRKLATCLPCCVSIKKFEKDVTALIGNQVDKRAEKILIEKRNKLLLYKQRLESVKVKKVECEKGQAAHPERFPTYFTDLIKKGYINLYDHLVKMKSAPERNARFSMIRGMSFSEISHVVLETREAVIQKVVGSIPAGSQNVLFLVGGSGAGKSTTLCLLRGDVMAENNFQYESKTDDKKLIGHEAATSRTFLPTVVSVNGLIIVDFPGFNDSNGQLVALGMEFALKALINQYHPKILVLEAITNNEGRYAAAAHLGLELGRLLESREKCILGITKYTKDPHFLQLRAFDEKKQKEKQTPSREEIELEAEIKVLESLNMDELQTRINEKKQKLQLARQQRVERPWTSTPEELESRSSLLNKENELKKQIGLNVSISFHLLNDTTRASSLEILLDDSKAAPVSVNRTCGLKAEDKALLYEVFSKNLLLEMNVKKDYPVELEDVDQFERSITESSLINTLFSQSNPEIGQFLHLPEIEAGIVRQYDREIVESCIKDFMESVIATLNFALIRKVLKEIVKAGADRTRVQELEAKFILVRDYIMGLLGVVHDDSEEAEKNWIEIVNENDRIKRDIAERFKLPTWAKILLSIPIGVPYGIYKLIEWDAKSSAESKALESMITNCRESLDEVYATMQKLKGIEKIIQKPGKIDEAFKSVAIDLTSKESLVESALKKIAEVKKIYGSTDWDKRVSFMSKVLVMPSRLSGSLDNIIAIPFAYFLLEPEVMITRYRNAISSPGLILVSKNRVIHNKKPNENFVKAIRGSASSTNNEKPGNFEYIKGSINLAFGAETVNIEEESIWIACLSYLADEFFETIFIKEIVKTDSLSSFGFGWRSEGTLTLQDLSPLNRALYADAILKGKMDLR